MKTRNIFIGLCIFLTTSCAQKIMVTYSNDPANIGELAIKPSRAIEGAYVTLNDELIVDKKYIKTVTVTGLPTGLYSIHMTSNSWYYKDKLDYTKTVEITDRPNAQLVEVPPYSGGYWAYCIGLAIIPFLFIPAFY